MGRVHRIDDDSWLLFRRPPTSDPDDPGYWPGEYFSENEIVCATDLTHLAYDYGSEQPWQATVVVSARHGVCWIARRALEEP